MRMFTEVVLCHMTHNSGPLHRVIRAGAARRSTNASLMPRRTNCKPTTQQDETGKAGLKEAEVNKGANVKEKIEDRGSDVVESKKNTERKNLEVAMV